MHSLNFCPTPRRILARLALSVTAALASGCYIGPGAPIFSIAGDHGYYSYKLYPGEALPASALAIVKLSSAYYARFDGLTVERGDYQEVQLLPGAHEITWGKWFGVSVTVDADMFAEGSQSATVDLASGHIYELHADRTHGRGYRMYFWILDKTTGEVVAGVKKP